MFPWSTALAGRLDEHVASSELLRGNPLGDSPDRTVLVYVPPGYDDEPERRYPTVYVLQGYTGTVTAWRNVSPFQRSLPQTADKLFASGDVPPAILVFVDGWTLYGGSQYVDSPGTGKHHSHFCQEIVPFVDATYRTLASPSSRGVMGHSSGGYGSMVTPMLRPDLFGALATHAGDARFDLCYVNPIPHAVRLLRHYDGDIHRWWQDFRTRAEDNLAMNRPDEGLLLAYLGVAACYSARPDGTVELPFDPKTGELLPDPWQGWLDMDPVRMVPRYADAVRSLRGIWIDAGRQDEFFLDIGAESFRSALLAAGVSEDVIRFELYDSTHAIPGNRYAMSLSWLTKLLSS